MTNYIRTYTGKCFKPLDPDPEKICIEDIAHALSMLCRGNGHVKTFWSVGEHCLLCAKEALARGYPARMVLACLLHDASECYLSDVPRPFKQDLPGYREREEGLLELIYVKFLGSPLSPEETKQLKEIDDAMLWFDLRHLLDEDPGGNAPAVHVTPEYRVRPFAEVEEEYLEMYDRCGARIDPGPAGKLTGG